MLSDLRTARARRSQTASIVLTELGVQYGRAFLFSRALRCPLVYRTGGVFFGAEFIRSPEFAQRFKRYRIKLRLADFVVSTRDGTPVDLFMERMGVPKTRYASFCNGFPEIRCTLPARDRKGILCLSRLSPEKNVDVVIDAFARAASRIDRKHKLLIAGEGPAADSCRALVARHGLSDRVDFLGHLFEKRDEVIRSAALMVAAFANNPIIEAIAARIPVLAVELGETGRMYRTFPNVHTVPYAPGGCGRVPAEARQRLVENLAEGMASLLADPKDYIYRIDESHSWQARIEKELAIYRTLCAGESIRACDACPGSEAQGANRPMTDIP
jgi:glycosyltransferase involved in cell wall biosynthesis